MANGHSGTKPASTAAALDASIADCENEYDALDKLRQRILVERMEYVAKHRASLTRDADDDLSRALEDLLATIDLLSEKRDAVAVAAATARWATLYPSDLAAASVGSEGHLALGLLNPVRESLGVTHQVAFAAVVAVLKTDANTLATRMTLDQRRELGTAPAVTPEDEAMWDSDERAREWARDKQKQLNEMARSALPIRQRDMAQEMRDD